jgi:quinoprotein glucose dehydrogenase
VEIGNTGSGRQAAQLVTPTLLFYTGNGRDGTPYLYAVNKLSGARRLGQIQLPASGRYGLMTYMHRGRQHVVVQIQGGLVALALLIPASR